MFSTNPISPSEIVDTFYNTQREFTIVVDKSWIKMMIKMNAIIYIVMSVGGPTIDGVSWSPKSFFSTLRLRIVCYKVRPDEGPNEVRRAEHPFPLSGPPGDDTDDG